MRISLGTENILKFLQKKSADSAALYDVFSRTSDGSRQSFYSLLYHLRKQGLIEKRKSDNGALWRISSGGLLRLKELARIKVFSVASLAGYGEEPDRIFKIIVFDVPASEDKKRYWLRAALKRCGFKILQKSVWLGKKKIPERFLDDLRERGMTDYVHIFAVEKGGALHELI